MNCDQVFDVLTRGPFPTGTSCDEPLEAHLNECPECRRLAEALRPAVELFQEAVDPEESRDLPGYWSAVATDRQAAVSYAPEVEPRRSAARPVAGGALVNLTRNISALTAWRMAAMLAVGVTLGLLLSARGALDDFSPSSRGSEAPGQGVAPPQKTSLGLADRWQLAALPAACLRSDSDGGVRDNPAGDLLVADADLARLQCCTGCHNAAADAKGPRSATVKVAQSCQLCHSEPSSRQFEPR